ncbi:MAG: twin transmembrane helix small protein [Woeseia sp.]
MKFVVLVLLAAVIASLGSALFFLARDRPGSPRMLNALKIRVALSVLLILFLVLSYQFGWLAPSN